ncbi:MAG: hypothetical protein AB7I30_01390 [Isosphaeraceae bacterium]
MRIYFFDVTVKVQHEGRAVQTVVRKSARAADDHQARRNVLDHYLRRGHQVVRLTPVEERTRRPRDGA